MQPYLFPYPGYFQLVAAVDRFVFYDDVQFIQRGWINRNATAGGRFTVPLVRSGRDTLIAEKEILADGYAAFVHKWERGFRHHYARAPHRAEVLDLATRVWFPRPVSIAELAERSVLAVAEHLELATSFVRSSDLDYDRSSGGATRMLNLLATQPSGGGATYINMAGGRDLYQEEAFHRRGWELRFLQPDFPADDFLYTHSILHLLAHRSPEACRQVLHQHYQLSPDVSTP